MLPISISKIIDINQLSRFFPLCITKVGINYTINKDSTKTLTLNIENKIPDGDDRNTKLEKQQITFHIYYIPRISDVLSYKNAEFLCDITQTMPKKIKNANISFKLDVEKYIPILLPDYDENKHGNNMPNYTGGLGYTYDTKKDGFSSPITFSSPNNIYYDLFVDIKNDKTEQPITA